jgi:hypothetical protein
VHFFARHVAGAVHSLDPLHACPTGYADVHFNVVASQKDPTSQTVVAPLHEAPAPPDVTVAHVDGILVGSHTVPCAHVVPTHD